MTAETRQIRLKSRPQGEATLEDFELVSVPLAQPGPGEVQVENLWMSVDPYMRGRMNDRKSYVPPFKLGEVMDGGAVGRVATSNAPGFQPGDLVLSHLGWREAFTAPGGALRKLDLRGLPPQAFLGVAGMPGLTAFVGLIRIAALKPGDVVFVSAAAGAVGSVVCQIAKLKGHTVIGSAGGADKAGFLRSIGVDQVIDYKAEPDLTAALKAAAPDGIDVYFDNVGGEHLNAALAVANPYARFALCGMISQYDAAGAPTVLSNLALAVGKRLRLEGFIVSDHQGETAAYLDQLSGWIEAGKLKWNESIEEGLENAPMAFLKLFSGQNLGKMLVKLR